MRALPWLLVVCTSVACGSVNSGGRMDAPGATDSALSIDAEIDAPQSTGPLPQLLWTMDGNVNNAGSLSGYTLTTPGSISYAPGKLGMAASFGAGQYAYVDGMRASLTTYAKVTIGFWFKEPGTLSSVAFLDCNNRLNSPYGGVQFGLSNTSVSLCVSTTTNSFLDGGCNGFTAPSANTWHHWLLRYDGSGTGAGQGAATEIYIDNVLVHTRANDTANNPVWNPGAPDRLGLGAVGTMIDDVRIYNQVFTLAEQCTYVLRGNWTGSSCTLP